MVRASQNVLSGRQRWLRSVFVAASGIGVMLLRFGEPAPLAGFPLPLSCGAVTGLPCLFCGLTRALHHLLNGEFARALYYNWLAFPLLALLAIATGGWVFEIVSRQRMFRWPKPMHLGPRPWAAAMLAVASLWFLQIYLAVSANKSELLNPAGPLYRWLVR